jgi:acetyl-CoA carboxylase beta subunit
MSKVRNFTTAKRFVALLKNNGELNEATLFGFAKQRKYEETVAALAELSQSTIDVIRALMQSPRDDGLLIPCKAAEVGWETVIAVLESRFSTGSMGPHELAKAKGQFAKMTTENARRLLRFWQVRSSSSPSSVN